MNARQAKKKALQLGLFRMFNPMPTKTAGLMVYRNEDILFRDGTYNVSILTICYRRGNYSIKWIHRHGCYTM